MKLNEEEQKAVQRLMHGQNKEDFRAFIAAIGNYAGELNEALIYGGEQHRDSLETRQGATRAVTDMIKAVEKATKTST